MGEEQDETKEHGRYVDGVYSAAATAANGVCAVPPAQARYYDTLLAQFRVVQATLRCLPPLEAVQALGDTRPISFPSGSITARRAWERHVLGNNPHPVQMSCMDIESIFGLVGLLRKLLRQLPTYSEKVRKRIGAWVWASIGKFPDRGELGGDEIARMRELAPTATTVLQGNDTVDEGSEDDNDEEADEIGSTIEAAMRTEMMDDSSLKQEEIESEMDSTRVILDMILTVVGEVYGQRDLLELRPKWTEGEIE